MRVLAFDPGFERLGIAIIDKKTTKEILLFSSCFRTKPTTPFSQRLRELGEEVERLIEQWEPSCIAVEDIFFEKNAKTAMQVAQVRGVLAYIAATRKLPLYSHTPLQVKVAITGYGQSSKTEVSAMLPRLIEIPARIRLDDEMDAIAIGLTCLATIRYPHTEAR